MMTRSLIEKLRADLCILLIIIFNPYQYVQILEGRVVNQIRDPPKLLKVPRRLRQGLKDQLNI